MKTTFVTAIYSLLPDGSIGRWDRYIYSFKSIVRTGANFVLFTSPQEVSRIEEFIKSEGLPADRIKIIPREITDNRLGAIWEEQRKTHPHCGRSMDLVHAKVEWLEWVVQNNPFGDEYFYWIDSGLSFSGMFPYKYFISTNHRTFEKYTDISLFNPSWVSKLNTMSQDKLYFMGLSNKHFVWAQPVDRMFYTTGPEHYRKFHIIGGLFGGRLSSETIKNLVLEYDRILFGVLSTIQPTECLPVEEVILNPLIANNYDSYYVDLFDTWYHEDHEPCFDPYKSGRSLHELFL